MTNFIGSLHLKLHHGPRPQEKSTAAYSPTAILLPLALAQFLASYDTGSMNVAISRIVEDLNTTVTGVQSAISIFTLTMAALMIPGSKLSDIWGRKRCFVLGLSVYAVGAFLTAIAPALGVMILGFSILEGIGSALMIPPIYILVTVTFSDKLQRAKAFAVISAAGGIGAASGPLIGGTITTLLTWRVSYLLEVFAIFFILSQHHRIRDPGIEGEKPPFDLLGAVLSALGLVSIVLGVLQAGNYGWITARKDFAIAGTTILHQGDISPVILFIFIGLVFLGLFALHIRHREKSGGAVLLQSRLFNSRTVNLGLVTQNMQWFTLIGTSFVVSVFLQMSRGYNAVETGLILSPAPPAFSLRQPESGA
jgi:MFS family permease